MGVEGARESKSVVRAKYRNWNMAAYNKATAGALGPMLVGILAVFVPGLDATMIAAIGTVLTGAMVYFTPNK